MIYSSRLLALILLLCLSAWSSAFVSRAPSSFHSKSTLLTMSSVNFSNQKPIQVTGNNIDMTPSIKEYVEKKVNNVLSKVGADVTKVDCHLTVDHNPRIPDAHKAEVTVYTKGAVIRAVERSEHMYGTIDIVTDLIFKKLRSYKEKKITSHRSGSAQEGKKEPELVMPEEVEETDSEMEGDRWAVPRPNMKIVKEKSFPMPPMTVEDAVTCLDYIDHDFYVFRNEATKEVNVVYKRKSGGVGLIQPERI